MTTCKLKNEHMNDLDDTIKKHFTAIKNRDIENLLETVDAESITLILPNGKYSNSLTEYKNVNSDWFSDKDWEIKYEITEKIIKGETGIVLTKITYADKDENGESYSFQYYLTLVFNLRDNEWKLIFDQNTIIK